MLSQNVVVARGQKKRMGTNPLADYIKRELLSRGMNERQFADSIDMHPSTLNNIINHPETTPRLESLAQIATGLGVSLSELIQRAGFPVFAPGASTVIVDGRLRDLLQEYPLLEPEDQAALIGFFEALKARKK